MQVKFKAACLITFFSICNFANAEVYLGISPGTSIEEIKEKFPNAAFVDMKPAWATNNIKLYQMQGYGLGGLVVIKLDDIRPILKKSMNLERNHSLWMNQCKRERTCPPPEQRSWGLERGTGCC